MYTRALVDAPTELEWKRMDTQKDLECENLDSLLNVSESENVYTQNDPDINNGVLDLHNVSESESRDTQLVNTQNGPKSGMEDDQNVPASKGVEFLDSHESKKVNTQNFIENERLKLPNELEYKGKDLLSVPVDKRVETQNIPEGGMEQNAPESKNVVFMDLHKSEKVETEYEGADTRCIPGSGLEDTQKVPDSNVCENKRAAHQNEPGSERLDFPKVPESGKEYSPIIPDSDLEDEKIVRDNSPSDTMLEVTTADIAAAMLETIPAAVVQIQPSAIADGIADIMTEVMPAAVFEAPPPAIAPGGSPPAIADTSSEAIPDTANYIAPSAINNIVIDKAYDTNREDDNRTPDRQDKNTEPRKPSTLADKETLFLQKTIYSNVIDILSSKNIKPWMKDCGLKPAPTLLTNKKLLLRHIEEAIFEDKTLTISFIIKLTKNLNDPAISTELFNFGIAEKENARARKTQLQKHLIDHFSNENDIGETCPQKTATKLKSRQVKRMRKSALNQSKIKPHKLQFEQNSKTIPGKIPDDDTPINPKPSSNPDDDTPSNPKPSSNPQSLRNEQNEIIADLSKSNTKVENLPKAVPEKGKRKKQLDNIPSIDRQQTSPENRQEEFEKPWKTLEANILELKDKSYQQENLLQHILSNTSGSDCGLTKIEASELQEKIKLLEKDNSTLLKTLEIQQGTLMHITNLENDIIKLKENMAIVLENNEKLLLSNKGDKDKTDNEKAATKKKKKNKRISKETQTEPERPEVVVSYRNTTSGTTKKQVTEKESVASQTQESFTKHMDTAVGSSLTDVDSQTNILLSHTPTTDIPFKKINWWDKTTIPVVTANTYDPLAGLENTAKTQPINKHRKENILTDNAKEIKVSEKYKSATTIIKEQKTRSTVPPPSLPSLVGKQRDDAANTNPENTARSPRPKQRCLLIHDEFHEGFDETKFSRMYDVKAYKMPLLLTVKKEMRNILSKITETKSDLVFLHTGFKDLWSGNKAGETAEDLKQVLSWLLERSEAQICVSLVIPGDGQYAELDKEVKILNRTITDHITELRKYDKYKNRVITINNNRLREFMSKCVGPQGTQLVLSSRGKNLLWLRLRDGLNRSLNPNLSSANKPINSMGYDERETYRRNLQKNTESRPRNITRNENY